VISEPTDGLETLLAMIKHPEALDAELQGYLDGEALGMLYHPLVTMPYFSPLHAESWEYGASLLLDPIERYLD
jgi:hypothetical protein